MAPGERLKLHPDLRIARVEVVLLEAPCRAPLLDERQVGRVHLALPGHQALGEALEHLDEELVHRAEVVVHEALVGARLGGQPPRRDAGVADLDEQALGGVQKGLGGRVRGRGRSESLRSAFMVLVIA